MRLPKSVLLLVFLSSVLAIALYAQRGDGRGGHTGGGGHVGGGGHPGAGGYHGGGSRGYYTGYYGGYFGGRYGYYGGRYYWPNFYFGFGLGYPYYGYYPYYYGYPYYGYGPYYYGYYSYPYGAYPTYSAPEVTIQHNYSNPNPQPQPVQPQWSNSQERNYYLIAFTNHVIEAATSFKVEGDQIKWITREGQQKQAPLSTVDVPFSKQVNRDRGVDFQIP